LNIFRDLLSDGFNKQFLENPLFQEMFGFKIELEAPKKLTDIEKRLRNSAIDKHRGKTLGNLRKQKTASHHD
jgi:hypothetical protein